MIGTFRRIQVGKELEIDISRLTTLRFIANLFASDVSERKNREFLYGFI